MTGNRVLSLKCILIILSGKKLYHRKGNVITTGILMPLSAANGVSQLESVDKYLKIPYRTS